jgi:PilZ domain
VEHRCGTRYTVDVPAYVRTRNSSASAFGRLRAVSASGGFVDTRLDVQPLSHVAVQLLTGRRLTSQPLVVEAQVIRVGLQGIYVEWIEYAPDLVRRLTEYPEPRESVPVLKCPETALPLIRIDDVLGQ